MNCSVKNIIVISVITFISTLLLLVGAGWLYLNMGSSGGGGTPTSDCGNLAGAWYKEDGGHGEGYVIMTIGYCTSEDTGELASYVSSDGSEWPMCGSLFVTQLTKSSGGKIKGPDIYCSDCKFRFNKDCNIELLSPCLSNFVSKDVDYVFQGNGGGWVIDWDNKKFETKYGTYVPLTDDQFPNTMQPGDQPTPLPNECLFKKLKISCGTSKTTPCGGSTDGYCCCDNDKSCCPKEGNISFLDLLGFV